MSRLGKMRSNSLSGQGYSVGGQGCTGQSPCFPALIPLQMGSENQDSLKCQSFTAAALKHMFLGSLPWPCPQFSWKWGFPKCNAWNGCPNYIWAWILWCFQTAWHFPPAAHLGASVYESRPVLAHYYFLKLYSNSFQRQENPLISIKGGTPQHSL